MSAAPSLHRASGKHGCSAQRIGADGSDERIEVSGDDLGNLDEAF
ncbi:MAG: hypothetical protein M5U19_14810 [Microthrixaceae bacterium]|nr:hypothetical protein [Microthrixaceae bacterium]